jgi:uncharacterized protein DUF2800
LSSKDIEKAHATWSASATSRNWECSGALALGAQVAHLDEESEAAGWGTACHSVSEWCLREGRDAVEMIGRVVKSKQHEFEVDEEMAETAQKYVDYVRTRLGNRPEPINFAVSPSLYVEQKFSLAKLKPPFDAGGTADAVIYFPAEKLLEVIDLKGGRGVKVEVTENKQLRTYAVGAVLANPGLDVERVRSTIVQPRMSHADGVIRSEEIHISDLMEWTAELKGAMNRSADAGKAYAAITGDISREEWAAKYLTAGDHCKFCPAAGFCPALEKKALDAAGVWFDDLQKPQFSNTPADLSPEKLASVLDAADMIQDYLNAARALAHSLAETGVKIANGDGEYILVDRIGRRRWKGEEADVKEQLFLTADLTDDEVYVQKLKSPAQIEKVLGAKRKKLIAGLIETPVTGTNLVRTDKTDRMAAAPAVHKHFDVIE